MPDDLQQLQQKIEEGLAAARELKRLTEEQKRRERPKLKLIKGGLVWGAALAGVEWFRDYRRTLATLAVSGLTVSGALIAEQPGSPGSDPPQSVKPPASVTPSVTPKVTVKPTPRPPRTSPLRTLGRSSTPVVAPTTPRKPAPTKTPRKAPSATPTRTPTVSPTLTPTVSLTETPSGSLAEVPEIVETPTLPPPVTTCAVDLLGVKVCLPLGRS